VKKGLGSAAVACLAVSALFTSSVRGATSLDRTVLESAVPGLRERIGGGRLGLGLRLLPSGDSWYLEMETPFPMQSVVKLPAAVAILREVDAGRMSLKEKVVIRRSDLSVAWSPLRDAFTGEEAAYTVEDLLRRAVASSDNTAFDVLLDRMKGAEAVGGALRALGIEGIRVDRSERRLQSDYFGLGAWTPSWAEPKAFEAARRALPASERRKALEAYLADPRDTATPSGAVELLDRLQRGALLSSSSTAFLLETMAGTTTGPDRLKAGLPEGSLLAHKTGTAADSEGINGATNDIGIATLPGGTRLALAVFVKGSNAPAKDRAAAIAAFARAAVRAASHGAADRSGR